MAMHDASPVITYFDVRGRAEVIRLLLEEVGVPYREQRVSVEQWPQLKPTLPFGQLPCYDEGPLRIFQSHAIYRHLARKHDLYGRDEAERVRCDVVEEAFVDAQNDLGGFFWKPDFAAKRAEYEAQHLPQLLARLQTLLLENRDGAGFWCGEQLSYVDFLAWHFLDYVRPFSLATLQQFAVLYAFKQRIESRPRVAAYLASPRRPRTLTVSIAPFGGTPETS
jgi:glutathione S-transferase